MVALVADGSDCVIGRSVSTIYKSGKTVMNESDTLESDHTGWSAVLRTKY